MRIDDLSVISLHLSERRIQFFRKIIHAFVDLQNAKKKKKKKKKKNKKKKKKKKNETSEVKINSTLCSSNLLSSFNMLTTS